MKQFLSRARIGRVLSIVGVAAAAVLAVGAAHSNAAPVRTANASTRAAAADTDVFSVSIDSLFGLSGKLRAVFLTADEESERMPVFARLFGDSLIGEPGVYLVDSATAGRSFAFVTMLPFAAKKHGRVGNYRMGTWPYEHRKPHLASYRDPAGFIRVTKDNQNTWVSEHFRLRDFLTKDQFDVWPKYLVLDEQLLDKLELVISDLEQHGVPVTHMQVMSGFRTPQYNVKGVGAGGRASNSRHQYGDAADVFVDNDRNGRLDDLNGDGHVNTGDVAVMVAAARRVERAHPELIGGAGTYRATSAHGPFAHIDARGYKATW